MKLQCVVTSYRRPLYLKPCIESIRQDDIELYIVDGGSDEETKRYIRDVSDGCVFMDNNPGADVLKNVGIQQFVTQPHFVMSSDDLLYPKGWSAELYRQYELLNRRQLTYAMLACSTESIVWQHDSEGRNGYSERFGVRLMETGISMVSGAMMDTAATRRVEYFPVYGKTGQGDIAISLRLRKLGYKVGYVRDPVLDHVGRDKAIHYPEYSAAFAADDAIWQQRAREDNWRPS